jgi:hypothetical protein
MRPRDGQTMSRDAVNQLNGTSTSSIVVTMLTLSSRQGAGPAANVEANAHRAHRPGTQHAVDAEPQTAVVREPTPQSSAPSTQASVVLARVR